MATGTSWPRRQTGCLRPRGVSGVTESGARYLCERNVGVVEEFFARLETIDVEGFVELWAEDGVQEMPFAPEGFPSRLNGKEDVRRQYGGMPQAYTRMKFPGRAIRPMLDPEWSWPSTAARSTWTRAARTTTATSVSSESSMARSSTSRSISTPSCSPRRSAAEKPSNGRSTYRRIGSMKGER